MRSMSRRFWIVGALALAIAAITLSAIHRTYVRHDLLDESKETATLLGHTIANGIAAPLARHLAISVNLSNDDLAQSASFELVKVAAARTTHELPIVAVELHDLQGRTVFATDSSRLGRIDTRVAEIISIISGAATGTSGRHGRTISLAVGEKRIDVVDAYVPVVLDGTAMGVIHIFADATTVAQQVSRSNGAFFVAISLILGALYFVLFVFSRNSQKILQLSQAGLRQRFDKQSDELNRTQERFERVFRHSPALLTIADLNDGTIYDVNDNWLATLGFERDEVIWKTTFDLSIWVDHHHRDQILELLAVDDVVADFRTQFRTKSGSILEVLISAEVVEFDGRRVMIGTATDITKQQRAESMLRDANARLNDKVEALNHSEAMLAEKSSILQAVLEKVEQGITAYDKDLNLIAWNDRVRELLDLDDLDGWSRVTAEDLFRHNASRGDYGEGDVEQIVRDRLAMIERQEPRRYERTGADGKVLQIASDPLPGGGFATAFTDVTLRRKTEEVLRNRVSEHTLELEAEIEERKRVQQALIWANDRFHKAFYASPSMISIIGSDDGVYHEVNEEWAETMGYGREEVVGKSAYELGIWANPDERLRSSTNTVHCETSRPSFNAKTAVLSTESFRPSCLRSKVSRRS